MENIKTPEEIYDKIKGVVITGKYFDEKENEFDFDFKDWFIFELEEYGKQRHNQAIHAAAENAKVLFERYSTKSEIVSAVHGKTTYSVSKDSILKLLEP